MDSLQEKCKEACAAAEAALAELADCSAELDALRAQLRELHAARPAADAGLAVAVERAMAREQEAAAAVLESARVASEASALRADLESREADMRRLQVRAPIP